MARGRAGSSSSVVELDETCIPTLRSQFSAPGAYALSLCGPISAATVGNSVPLA